MPSNASFTSRLESRGPRKKRRPLEPWMKSGIRENMVSHLVIGIGVGGLMTETRTMKIGGTNCSKGLVEMAPLQTRTMLIQKAKTEILNRLSEWSMVKQVAIESSSSKKKVKEQHKELEDASSDGMEANVNKLAESMDVNDADNSKKPFCVTSIVDMETDCVTNRMSVPDLDFYDFDKNRVETSFGSNQIWAMYDDNDGMPRYYVLIHNLISTKPF